MKHLKISMLVSVFFITSSLLFSCKGKTDTTAKTDTTTVRTTPQIDTVSMQPAPVQISPDDSLNKMAKDAVKDYPGVTTSVNNGEITLTGNITRDKLPKVMMAISATHPKKINNNLTIK